MKKGLILLTVISMMLAVQPLFAQKTAAQDQKMEWWREARFGMFIHWGVYSVFEGKYKGHEQNNGGAEWIMNRMKIPVLEYQAAAKRFNPVKFNADKWVKMAKDAGMKYIVITTKHHDGFALFDTEASDWNMVDATPYGKDVIKALAESCEKYGMKLGFYYSQAQDWNNPGGAVARKLMKEGWDNPKAKEIDAYTKAHQGHWDSLQTTKSLDEYINEVAVPQVKELLTKYGKISIFWWDTPMGIGAENTEKLHDLMALQPGIITNDRLTKSYADYITPEQRIPKEKVEGKDFEVCMTMNNTWGYRSSDQDWKSVKSLVRNLIDIASKGGNYLLNVGPKPDGTFPQPSKEILKGMGKWMKVNGEAIYGTHSGPMENPTWGRFTMKKEKGKTFLYLSVFDWPESNELMIPGIKKEVQSALLLKGNKKLKIKKSEEGLTIKVPRKAPDDLATVIKLELKG